MGPWLAITLCVIVVACLLFGAYLFRTGDVQALREGGRFIAKIPMPRITIKLPSRKAPEANKPSGSGPAQ